MASRTVTLAFGVAVVVAALSCGWLALSCNPSPFPSATSQICGYLQVKGNMIPAMTTNADAGCTLPADAGDAGVVPVDALVVDAEVGTDGSTSDGGLGETGARDGAAGAAAKGPSLPPNSVSSTATGIQFIAMVTTATAGQWQLTATASGALALTGAEQFSISFNSSGAQVIIAIPLTIASTSGLGSVQITVGDSTQDFLFVIEPVKPAPSPTCIRSTDGGTTLLSWVVEPPAPLVVVEDGGVVVVDGGRGVGTLIVDVRDLLLDCDDGGATPLSSTSVSVVGTGGLAAMVTPVTSDPSGNVAYELRGPAVVDAATALLSIASGATTVVTVTLDGGQ